MNLVDWSYFFKKFMRILVGTCPWRPRTQFGLVFIAFVSTGLLVVKSKEVVVYCALDQPYAEPILLAFERESGIRVKVVYDSEAIKTAGLVNRLIAERKRPQCDVFWNNEKLRSLLLAQRGLLEKYESPRWKERNLPPGEKNGLWTEFAARARVIVYQPSEFKRLKIPEEFKSSMSEIEWLTRPPAGCKVAIAYPLFGTTSTQFLEWLHHQRKSGKDPEKWLQQVAAQKPLICQGNSDVVRRVVAGEACFGFTDSDDVMMAKSRGEPVDFFFPESADPLRGTLIIPNVVSIIKSAPHRKEAEMLVDFLLSEKTEIALAQGSSRQIPLGEIRDIAAQATLPFASGKQRLLKMRRANEEELLQNLEKDFELLRKTFHR